MMKISLFTTIILFTCLCSSEPTTIAPIDPTALPSSNPSATPSRAPTTSTFSQPSTAPSSTTIAPLEPTKPTALCHFRRVDRNDCPTEGRWFWNCDDFSPSPGSGCKCNGTLSNGVNCGSTNNCEGYDLPIYEYYCPTLPANFVTDTFQNVGYNKCFPGRDSVIRRYSGSVVGSGDIDRCAQLCASNMDCSHFVTRNSKRCYTCELHSWCDTETPKTWGTCSGTWYKKNVDESVKVVVDVTGVNDANKDMVCDAFAASVIGTLSYCSLSGPNTGRRMLTTSLYMDIHVADAKQTMVSMGGKNFISNKVTLPTGIQATSLTVKIGETTTTTSPTSAPSKPTRPATLSTDAAVCMVSLCKSCDITGAKISVGDLSLEECKQKCLDQPMCKGISFGKRDRAGECHLNMDHVQNQVYHKKFDAWSLKKDCTGADLIRLTEGVQGVDKFYQVQPTNDGHGFLQMKMGFNKEWYTVNAEGFGKEELAVACHQLGFARTGAHTMKAVILAPGLYSQDKFINNVRCDVNAQRLQDCMYDSEDQSHRKAIEVTCGAKTNLEEDSSLSTQLLTIIIISIVIVLLIISLSSICLYKYAQQQGKVMNLEFIKKAVSDLGGSGLKDVESPYFDKTLSADLGSSEMKDIESGAGSVEGSHNATEQNIKT